MPISLALPVSLVSLTNGAAGADRRVGTGAAAEKAVSGSEKPEAFAAASACFSFTFSVFSLFSFMFFYQLSFFLF